MHKNTQGRVTNPRNGYKLDEKQNLFILIIVVKLTLVKNTKCFL